MTMTTFGYTMVMCGSSDDPQNRYRGRIEKVKFGVPIAEAFNHDIPATLLVLLLKVNKDGPSKKDIWRAPGNQAQVRKLSQIMQHGRLVNIANFSVYTAASVIKKFLSKLPGGIFGLENEQLLFDLFYQSEIEIQRQVFCRVVSSLSGPSQHFLVLLFGTFYLISDSANSFGTKMTPDAIGISVAPSLFHSCIHDGQRARMEDVMRFKMASEVVSRIIQNFGYANLFPRDCYEFYARITGRTLHIDENDLRFKFTPVTVGMQHSRSQPDLRITQSESGSIRSSFLPMGIENPCDVCGGVDLLLTPSLHQTLSSSTGQVQKSGYDYLNDEFAISNLYNENLLKSTHSLSYLELVHEKQTKRMRTRSEWFLSPAFPSRNASELNAMYRKFSMHRGTAKEGIFECSPTTFNSSFKTKTRRDDSYKSTAKESDDQSFSQIFTKNMTKNVGSIVRRRSWRTHYVRPNKSLDSDNRQDFPESAGSPSSHIYRQNRISSLCKSESTTEGESGNAASTKQ